MAYKSPEEELEQFLVAQPSWRRKILQYDVSLTPEEQLAWNQSDWLQKGGEVQDKYESILRRIPAKWREYRKRQRQNVLAGLSSGQPGRPNKDALAEEAKQLRLSGKSYAEIAKELNLKHGTDTTTQEATRKLISRKR